MSFRQLMQLGFGIATFFPGVERLRSKGTGGTDSARYCYSVWLRHLVMAKRNGLNTYPKVVAELGPGDSLGIGLAALISGSNKYLAFDVVEHADTERNLKVFDELVGLFRNRASIPGDDEFPHVRPQLENYAFPDDIFSANRLELSLDKIRLDSIRDSIINFQGKDSVIQYKVPWYDARCVQKESVDMIFSQAVLEHVDDLQNTYRAMWLWLQPSGYISHQIDFRCHGTAEEWNGHWKYSDFVWKLIRGRRPFLLNREPLSAHEVALKEAGFSIVFEKKAKSESRFAMDRLAPRFRSMSEEDLTTSGAYIQGVKTG